jgi:putative ABC transport system substrate-binding protein
MRSTVAIQSREGLRETRGERVRSFVAILLFLSLAASVAAQTKAPRIGLLAWGPCSGAESPLGIGLRDLGYRWGETIQVVCRSANGDHARLQEAARALVDEKVDVIAGLTHVTAYAASKATGSIPIVMIASGDPVATGLVGSLARPGGNVTGLTYYATELVAKRLQLLKEIVPNAARVAVLGNTQSDHVFGPYRQDTERAAKELGLQLVRVDVGSPRDLDAGFELFASQRTDALLVLTDPMIGSQAKRIAELAAQYRLPAIYWAPWFVEAGGLVAYAPDYDSMMRRAAYYVDRVLKGARPPELPVEQPTTFELSVNVRTAKALGLAISEAILARATRVLDD